MRHSEGCPLALSHIHHLSIQACSFPLLSSLYNQTPAPNFILLSSFVQKRTRLMFSLTVTHSRRLLPYLIYSVKCPCQFTLRVSSITLLLYSSIQPALPVDDLPLSSPPAPFHCSFASFHLSFALGLKPA